MFFLRSPCFVEDHDLGLVLVDLEAPVLAKILKDVDEELEGGWVEGHEDKIVCPKEMVDAESVQLGAVLEMFIE